MHHFISYSTWDASGVMDKVAKDVSKALPKQKLTGLLIDESGWEKKGDKSVGVGHQTAVTSVKRLILKWRSSAAFAMINMPH